MTTLLDVTIYHNPACGTSRNTLALIRNTGIEPNVIEYLKTPPTRSELIQLIQDAKLTVREAIRKNVDPYRDLALDREDWTDEQLISFMLEYPILINRPFVVTERGTRLCRPSELVLDILTLPQKGAFTKEDGEQVIDENGKRVTAGISFVPENEEGTIEMTFELDARRLAGKSVVVFERLYDEEEHLIAKEEDIENAD